MGNAFRSMLSSSGGGSYTAGDGIDITNDVISTKQSEEGDIDEIVDVYPQAGNLVSIVNAFNKGDIYSTDEKMIGQWYNGKPLYQKYCTKTATNIDESLNGSNDHPRTIYTKTYTAPATVILRNIVAYTDVSSNDGYIVIKKNSEQLLKMYIISDKNTAYDGEVSISMALGDVLTVEGNWDNSHSSIKWRFSATNLEYDIADAESFFEKVPNVLNYTKTTDTAISIGEATEYSTDEKIIGTWIDGSPVYQKTWTGLNVSVPVDNDWHEIIGTDIPKSSIIVDAQFYFYASAQSTYARIVPAEIMTRATGDTTGVVGVLKLSEARTIAIVTAQYVKPTT